MLKPKTFWTVPVFLFCALLATPICLLAAPPDIAETIGCRTRSSTRLLRLKSAVHARAGFLKSLSRSEADEFIRAAIEMQIRHLIGVFKAPEFDEKIKAAMGSYRGSLKIGSRREKHLDRSPHLDSFWPADRGAVKAAYISWAERNPDLLNAVEAIDYETDLLIMTCEMASFDEPHFERALERIYIPADPYLTAWVNSKSERRALIWGPFSVPEAPPCFSEEFAKFGVPDDAWYFWSPFRKGCLLKNNPFVVKPRWAPVHFQPEKFHEATALEPLRRRAGLDVAVIFGKIVENVPQFEDVSYSQLRQRLIRPLDICRREKTAACLGAWAPVAAERTPGRYEEVGFGNLRAFLKYVNSLFELKSYRMRDSPSGLTVEMTLAIRNTAKHIDMSVYYGPTGVHDAPAHSPYWKFMHSALYSSDAVLYLGHSGLGQNLKLATLRERAGISKPSIPKARRKDLWLGIFNCEGFSYFGQDLAEIFAPSNSLFLLASSGMENSSKFPLVFLHNVIDSSLSLNSSFTKHIQSWDFLTVQKISP